MQQTHFNIDSKKDFYPYLSAQFLSALADNALLFAAIALLAEMNAPTWHQPLLLQFFVLAYILLAPFVGAFADSRPKGQVMFLSNGIKLFGCLAMFFGMEPLYAYGIVASMLQHQSQLSHMHIKVPYQKTLLNIQKALFHLTKT